MHYCKVLGRQVKLGIMNKHIWALYLSLSDHPHYHHDHPHYLDDHPHQMKEADKALTGMEKWCGLFVCPWNKSEFQQLDHALKILPLLNS